MSLSPRSFSASLAIESAAAADFAGFVRTLLGLRAYLASDAAIVSLEHESFGTLALADVEALLCSCAAMLESERAERILAAEAARRAPLRARLVVDAAVAGARYVTAEGLDARIENVAGDFCRVRITLAPRRIKRMVMRRDEVGALVIAADNAKLAERMARRAVRS